MKFAIIQIKYSTEIRKAINIILSGYTENSNSLQCIKSSKYNLQDFVSKTLQLYIYVYPAQCDETDNLPLWSTTSSPESTLKNFLVRFTKGTIWRNDSIYIESLILLPVGISFKVPKRKIYRITHMQLRRNVFSNCNLKSDSSKFAVWKRTDLPEKKEK